MIKFYKSCYKYNKLFLNKNVKKYILNEHSILRIIIVFLLIIYFKLNFTSTLDSKKFQKFYLLLPYVNKKKKKPKSLTEIYESKQLYINEANLTKEYIKYIKIIDEHDNYKNSTYSTYFWKDKKFYENSFPKRKNQLNYKDFGKLCYEEKLINSKNKNEINKNPLISIIVVSFNKENILLKSIRSIQNQSLKNIEIIIVDDFSKDKSYKIYNYLLQSDPRIRIFYHLKNFGVWRSRIDGFLYSKGKYVIHFDAGDMYEDNYVLEDSYNIIKKYNIDSIKTLYRFIYDFHNLSNSKINNFIKKKYTKIAFQPNIKRYFKKYFKYGYIWTTLVKRNIYFKGLILLSNRILNLYKNYWEDQWWKNLVNNVSESLLILKRYSYLYFKDGKGEGDFKINTEREKNKMIQEHLAFLYFDLEFLPKDDNKHKLIKKLRKYDNNSNILNFGFLKSNFNLLDDLVNELIKDKYVSINDKIFLYKLLNKSKHKNWNSKKI